MSLGSSFSIVKFGAVALFVLGFSAMPTPNLAATNNDDRTIEFVNMCSTTVRIGVNGAALLTAGTGARKACNATTLCPAGSSCLQPDAKKDGACYFDFPAPSSGSAVLKPKGSTTGTTATYELTNPVWSNGVIVKGGVNNVAVKWSGNVYAATHCDADGSNCKTGMCPKSENGVTSVVPCETGVGPQGPTTLAEFTLSNTGVDFYDISMVNGANIPVAMAPADNHVYSPTANDFYWCGTPGATTTDGAGLSACTWKFDTNVGTTDQASVLRAVASGGPACSATKTCSDSTQVCGYSYEIGTLNVTQSCGEQIGWWNANELCAFTNGGFGAPLNCQSSAGKPVNQDLFQCIGTNAASCYGAGGSDCCGCPEWKVGGVKIPLASGFSCKGTNTQWSTIAEPWVNVNKQACPTAYSFPFDDATSTFTCSSELDPTEEKPNAVNYTITFCPDGKSGFEN